MHTERRMFVWEAGGERMLRHEMNYHKIHEAHHFLWRTPPPSVIHSNCTQFYCILILISEFIFPRNRTKTTTAVITEPIWGTLSGWRFNASEDGEGSKTAKRKTKEKINEHWGNWIWKKMDLKMKMMLSMSLLFLLFSAIVRVSRRLCRTCWPSTLPKRTKSLQGFEKNLNCFQFIIFISCLVL